MVEAKRLGRPLKPPADRKSANVKFRVRNGIHERITAAAAASGNSRSEEVEARLEGSFRNDDLRTIIREEIRAALVEQGLLNASVVAARTFHPDEICRAFAIAAHSRFQSQTYDRSALNRKQ